MFKNKCLKVYLIVIIFVFVCYITGENIYLKSEKTNTTSTSKKIKKQSNISMMLETGSGTGIYVPSDSNEWPTDGYLFNQTLSRCENGGEVSWDYENNQVIMIGNTSDKCYIYFDSYLLAVVNDITLSQSATSISVSVSATAGTTGIIKYMYSINDSEYLETNTNLYTFSNLTPLETYNIKVYVVDTNNKSSLVVSKSVKTNSPTIADVTTNGTNLATAIKSFSNWGVDVTNIYVHTSSLANSAGDGSYRYAGTNPNNYICFGSTASVCPSDNLYRIIGVFGNNVKLIKADCANSNLLGTDGAYNAGTSSGSDFSDYKGSLETINRYHWNNDTKNNTWSSSNLNTVNLNTNFLNNIGTDWANKIASSSWETGGNSSTKLTTVPMSTIYQNEIVSPNSSVTVSAKVGLMYLSDYGYAASSTYWSYPSYNVSDSSSDYRAAKGYNWMFLGVSEWSITRSTGLSTMAFHVYNPGYFTAVSVSISYVAVRPVFYLNTNVTYSSGIGTSSSPIRLN